MPNHRITIERGGQLFGPYDESQISYYISNNKILLNDSATIDNDPKKMTVAAAMRKCSWKIPKSTGLLKGFRQIGVSAILPWDEMRKMQWLTEKKFLYLAIIGLLPLLIVLFSNGYLTYVAIATYFSVLWGLFFLAVFQTNQVQLKKSVLCFVFTAFISIIAVLLLHELGFLTIADKLAESNVMPIRFIGMFFAAGLPEEISKAAVIFFIARQRGEINIPQTLVIYGLFSGLGFGISEGILYQLGLNHEQGIDVAYFLNVLRLTSLPFLHAVWCGIASYFISFATLFPMYRHSLWIIAIIIPAFIHALYNSTGRLSVVPAFVCVLLFTIYLSNIKNMRQKLI